MNKESAKKYLPIIQAFADGKTIQYLNSGHKWVDSLNCMFSAAPERYRIKPESVVVYTATWLSPSNIVCALARTDKQEVLRKLIEWRVKNYIITEHEFEQTD